MMECWQAQPFAVKREVSRESLLPLCSLLKTQQRKSDEKGEGGEGECLPGSVYVKVIDMQMD